ARCWWPSRPPTKNGWRRGMRAACWATPEPTRRRSAPWGKCLLQMQDLAHRLGFLAVETHRLRGGEHVQILGVVADLHARQQHLGAEATQVGAQLPHVVAREFVAC